MQDITTGVTQCAQGLLVHEVLHILTQLGIVPVVFISVADSFDLVIVVPPVGPILALLLQLAPILLLLSKPSTSLAR
jgi:hypothetical protein